MTRNVTKYKVFFLACIFSLLQILLYRHDGVLFNEAIRLDGRWKQWHLSSLMTPDELTKAFHLRENLRSLNSNVILIWHSMFGYVEPIGDVTDDGCVLTYDRSAIDVAKAVVFHFAEIDDVPSHLPVQHRKEWQRWTWWCLEPPWNTRYVFGKNLASMKNTFNWTMTYRLDSDITMTYIDALPPKENRTVKEMIEYKTAEELGIALISNCWSSSRETVITELQQHIKIDVRGKCTGNPLCRGECALQTIRRYKFFFAFENSRCKDYITEKFFYQGIHGGAVPVVLGPPRSNYELIAPRDSFIHVDDFESVKELADHLLLLDKDDEKYGNYLKWRSSFEEDSFKANVHMRRKAAWRTLCEKVKSDPVQTRSVSDLALWWYGNDYTPSATKFSMCSADSGPSGFSMQMYLRIGYSAFVAILFLISMKCWL